MRFARFVKYGLKKNKFKNPIYLIFFVTKRCNSRCKTCFYWKQLNRGDGLSLVEIKKIARNINKLEWLVLTGGEPFLRNDISDIARIFYDCCEVKSITIPTNGLLSENILSRTKDILNNCPNLDLCISVSLDGVGKLHDEIRGVDGNFEKAVLTIRMLQNLRSKNKRLYVKVCTVLNRDNCEYVSEIGSFVKNNLKVDFHSFELIRGNPLEPGIKNIPDKLLKKLSQQILDVYNWYYFNHNYSFIESIFAVAVKKYMLFRNIELLKGNLVFVRCLAKFLAGVVYSDGEFSFCEMREPFVNVKEFDYDLKRIYSSGEAKKERGKIPKLCNCTHSSFQNLNLMFNFSVIPKILFYHFKTKFIKKYNEA